MMRIHSKSTFQENRRGIAILWLILWGSFLMVFFCVVLEVATLWQAQVEINNAMDSAALAAVGDWGVSGIGSTEIPRNVGVAYTASNPILGVAYSPQTNYGTASGSNPNANASNTGNFVFGAIDTTTDPVTFNGNADVGCAAGDVTIRITDSSAGGGVGSVDPNSILLSFDAGTNLAIDSIKFILPDQVKGPAGAYAFFRTDIAPQVLITTPFDLNGVDTEPSSDPPPVWSSPNGNGDISFTFEDLYTATEAQSFRINFNGNSFTENDFLNFGVSTNQLGPSGYPSPYPGSVGDAWGYYGVTVEVDFRNTITNQTSTGHGVFVDVAANNVSEATLSGGAGGGFPAVLAQVTVPVQGYCSSLFGVTFFNVSASSVAYYDCNTNRTATVNVSNFTFP
ncbi:pilus assembly protein TadG-related protein [Gimesia maris]|uniref:pilus assembly protein TadG-related protein n=1 Tax=Gimesia maris TaxID=122 RepID=UPI0030DAC5CC|tara:strand:- start:1749 stop:2933 length:1185 start_codon:yes stop_codon:yes gene_type:complete